MPGDRPASPAGARRSLREHSLTRAARLLNVTQPALSKTLARLRRYFGDPLFVRVSLRMEPTPKALALAPSISAIIEQMRTLRSEHTPVDPKTTSRTFNFCVVDAGLIKLLPPLVRLSEAEAPHVRLRAMQLDAQHLELPVSPALSISPWARFRD